MKPLTLQQAREFIAEKAGWKKKTVTIDIGFIESVDKEVPGWESPSGEEYAGDYHLPDYFNAVAREALYWMHKAEAVLTETQWHTYNAHLNHLTLRERLFATVSATAPQRARAFCRVFGYTVEL